MVTAKTLKIFLSYSFDEADEKVIQTIVGVFRRRRFKDRIELYTAQELGITAVLDKIADLIDTCDITLAVFIKRFDAKAKDGSSVALPPPFIISEPSYALGSYRAFGQARLVGGFCETGIDFKKHLGLLSLPDIEWIIFERNNLEQLREQTVKLAEKLLARFGKILRVARSEYRQNRLEKRVSLFPDGSVITENRVLVEILDASAFSTIPHYIRRTELKPLPSWDEMLRASYKDRFGKPYFFF